MYHIQSKFWNDQQLYSICHGKGERGRKLGRLSSLEFPLSGTGPLAHLSLFPVAELDKESND